MIKLKITILLVCLSPWVLAQDQVLSLSQDDVDKKTWSLDLSKQAEWIFQPGHQINYADPELNTRNWLKMNPAQLPDSLADEEGKLEGWFRLKIRVDTSLTQANLGLYLSGWASKSLYINGVPLGEKKGNKNFRITFQNPLQKHPLRLELKPNTEYTLALHWVEELGLRKQLSFTEWHFVKTLKQSPLQITVGGFQTELDQKYDYIHYRYGTEIAFNLALSLLFWIILFTNSSEKNILLIALAGTFNVLLPIIEYQSFYPALTLAEFLIFQWYWDLGRLGLTVFIFLIPAKIFRKRIDMFTILFLSVMAIFIFFRINPDDFVLFLMILSGSGLMLYYMLAARKGLRLSQWVFMIGLLSMFSSTLLYEGFESQIVQKIGGIILKFGYSFTLAVYLAIRFRENFEERKKILENQNQVLEQKVHERTEELNASLDHLKSTQNQLVQAEKLASLGELTAGIAHEIQNPLNFVNNFSEVSSELVDEMKEELKNGDLEEVEAISEDLKQNLEKINHHGQRADAIVKNMLAHSRAGGGEKSLTDLNALAEEYLRLSFHGLRAKDKSFQADFEAQLEEGLPPVEVVSQEIGRVLLNLYNNAFYAVHQKAQKGLAGYKPKVSVQTRSKKNGIEIVIRDNGTGMPEEVKEKIFQPFFTTKPTGQGTGLGLSLAYDIISKGHEGRLEVETEEGKGTCFIIQLAKKI